MTLTVVYSSLQCFWSLRFWQGHRNNLFFISQSVFYLLMCLRLLSSCIIQYLTDRYFTSCRILWYRGTFTITSMTARNSSQKSSSLHKGVRQLVWGVCTNPVFDFLLTFGPGISTLTLPVQSTLFHKSFGLFRCNFENQRHAAIFFWKRRGFFLKIITGVFNERNQTALLESTFRCMSETMQSFPLQNRVCF